MNDQLLTLSKIFTERLFRIPDYQRGFAWSEKQLKDFWNDLQQLEPQRNHYTGVLTLENVPDEVYDQWEDDGWIIDAKNYQPYFIVDGQQRMTTVIILIQVMLEQLEPNEKLNFTSRDDIQRRFIFDSKDDGISRSYIFGYERDNPSYEFLKTKIFREHSSSALGQETVYTQNLANAKEFFAQRITEFSHEDLEVLYRKVTQQLLFNIFTITEDVDVCVAFETMNNRGKPLSYLELLKNRLVYLSLKFDAPDFEREKLRRAINDCWKAIYHNLGRNKEQPLDDDRFLLTHYLIYFGEQSEDGTEPDESRRFLRVTQAQYVNDLLENRFVPRNVTSDAAPDKRITLSDVYHYVSSLQEAVELWYKIWNPFDSSLDLDTTAWLDKISRLNSPLYHPLLLVYLQSVQSQAHRTAFLQALERLLFVEMLGDRSYARPYMTDIVDLRALQLSIALRTGRISAERVTKHISDLTTRLLREPAFLTEVVSRFRTGGFYRWRGLRYFLFEYNLDLQRRSKTDRPKIFWPEFTERKEDYVSVEHIFPQYARDDYWAVRFGHLTQKQRTALRESLGNLLPLSKPKNSSLSNKPFPVKVDGKPDMTVGYRYGCYAENEVAKQQDWTPEQIIKRGINMVEFMEKRWAIEFGNEDQKKKMLGLEFVK